MERLVEQKRRAGVQALAFCLGLCALLPARPVTSQEPAGGAEQAEPAPKSPPWDEIVQPASPPWPQPRHGIHWYQTLDEGFAVARQQDRPLLVLLHCNAVAAGKNFPARVQKAEGLLANYLPFFITVELRTIQGLDLARLPVFDYQDLDLPWWCFMLSPEGRVYAVYGGQEQVEDSSQVSIEGLASAMSSVLSHHCDPRRPAWDIDGPLVPKELGPMKVFDLPGWPSWSQKYLTVGNASCVRCHQVAQVERQAKIDQHLLDKQRDLNAWPLLENLGLKVAAGGGLYVTEVTPGPATRAGITVGDTLVCAGGRRLYSPTDLRGVLHRSPVGAGKLDIHWLRDGMAHHGTLVLPEGWRRTRIDWRPSIIHGNVGADCGIDWLEKLDAKERGKRKLPLDGMALRPHWKEDMPPTYVQAAGLTENHVIIAVNDQRPDIDGPTLQFAFRMRFDPGDTVRLTVRADKGVEQVISFRAQYRAR